MKNIKRVIALALSLISVLSLFACGKEQETETETETEALPGHVEQADENTYLGYYADYDAMNAWLDENINGTDVPPVSFTLGSSDSSKLSWVKEVGELNTVIDYPDSDSPATRYYREITYTCEEKGIKVIVTLTSYPNYPVVEYDSVIINTSDKTTKNFIKVYATDSDIATNVADEVTVHYNKGSTCENNDFEPYTETLGVFDLSCGDDGRPTNEYMPNLNYEYANGGGVITVINWQAAWKLKSSLKDGKISFKAGQKTTYFQLLAGEEYNVPGIVLLFYKNGDWQEGQNVWRRWMIEHNLMRYTGRHDYDQNIYICSNTYESSDDIEALEYDASLNVSDKYNLVFTIDAGWYPEGLGNWYHTGNYYPGGTYSLEKFQKISEIVKSSGMGFCLWFEPERVYADTEQAEALGDNVIYGVNGVYAKYSELKDRQKSDTMGIINYGVKEVEDYVVNLVDNAVKTYGLTNYRQDYNTSNAWYFSIYDDYEEEQLGINRSGLTESKYCQGYINAWSRIAELNPGLVFDCCASGGRRMDLESMRFSYVHTKSDNWIDPNSQQCQNFALYSWNIFTGTAFQNTKTYDIRTRLTLSIGIDVWLNDKMLDVLEQWTKQQKYMFNDYYSLGEYNLSSKCAFGLQFNDYENGEGMIMVYLRGKNLEFTVIPHGLNADSTYYVYDEDGIFEPFTMTGVELMTNGFTVSSEKKAAVEIWYSLAETTAD